MVMVNNYYTLKGVFATPFYVSSIMGFSLAKKVKAVSSEMGSRLTKFRQHMMLSQRAAASRYKCHINTWQRVEAGERVPGGPLIEALSEDDLNINWLMTGEGLMINSTEAQGDLTTDEESMLNLFRRLDQTDRDKVKVVLNAFASSAMVKDKTG